MTDKKPKILTVVITGASAGLGRAIAQVFAKAGHSIGLIARDAAALEETAKEVRQFGGKAFPFMADVSDPDAVESAAQEIEAALGPIDIWINNAMVSVFSPVKEMEASEFRRVIEVNYLGYVHGTQAALRRMLPRDCGRILQIGSALAVRSIPLQSAYCASKHAIAGFTDSLRCELHHDKSNVGISMIQMPAMNTPQFTWVKSRLPRLPQPVPPIFQPEVAARVVLEAATTRHLRREYWVGASTVKAILGQKVIPGLLDRYLGHTGYDAQQRKEPDSPSRPHNLWEPVATHYGAHGPFDKKASTWSAETIFSKPYIGLATVFAAAIASAFVIKKIHG